MIQFNLLPDIKIAYLKAKRQKQLVMLISTITIIVSVVALVILSSIVFFLQKHSISSVSADITSKSSQLKNTPNLDKILTVQNQLNSLPALHAGKPDVARLFGYLQHVTPVAASISTFNADFSKSTLLISGNADTLATVTTFTDALKLATYHTDAKPNTEKAAFGSVVLSSFSRDSKGTTYTIMCNFDATLFQQGTTVTLTVPNVTARSSGQAASDLFKQSGTGQ